MSIVFNPSGHLDVSTDPSDLPETADQYNIQSNALTRCKNLRIDQKGVAKTRLGSGVSQSGYATPIWLLQGVSSQYYVFAGTKIYLTITEIESGLTSANWSAINYNAFNSLNVNVFALNGTDRKRIFNTDVYEWGIEPPSVAPVNSAGTSTGLTGTYNTKYTYVRKEGSVVVSESNPSPEGNAFALTDDKLNVSVTATADTQVTHIRLYRTFSGGEEYFFDQDIAVGSTSFVSTQVDADLGDLLEEDHDRPPVGTFVFGPAYDGTCFIISSNRLYFSKPKQPEYWPATNYIEVSTIDEPLICGLFHNGQPYVMSIREIYYIQGTGGSVFLPLPMKAKCGTRSLTGTLSIAGKGIFHLGLDGIYLFASGVDNRISDEFTPLFRGESVNDIPYVHALTNASFCFFRNMLYFTYRGVGNSYPSNILVLDLDSNRVSYYQYISGVGGFPVEFISFLYITSNNFLYIGDSLGNIRVIESDSFDLDNSAQIEFDIQSKDFVLATRKHFPRWVKYDVDASDAVTCEGELILGGSTLHTHTITGERDTRRRLVEADNGSRCAIRISGTGPVSIYGAESE